MTTLFTIWALAGGFSFLAARSSYYILKFLAGASWVASGLYWQASPPTEVAAGSSIHVIIMLLLWIFGISFMFYPFWRSNGENTGKVTPFWRSNEEDEIIRRGSSTRQQRNATYSARVGGALRGRR